VILQLIHNIALLVALVVGMEIISRRMERHSLFYGVTTGLLFGAVAIIGMMTPLHFAPGVIYDGRSIVLSLAGLFGGPLSAALAVVVSGAYRLHLGGTGMLAGVGTIIEAAALGTALYYLRQRNDAWVRPARLWAFGILVHIIMLAMQLLLIPNTGRIVLQQIGLSVLIFYPIGFLLIALVFLNSERRQKAEHELQETVENLREAQNIAHMGRWELNLLTNHLTWSDGIFAIFEVNRDSFPASYEAFLSFVHPDDRPMVDQTYRDSVKNKKPYAIEHRLLMRDGRIKWVSEIGRTEYNVDGRPIRSVGTVQDITDRKRDEENILQLNAELEKRVADRTAKLEAANQELEAFTYSVAHDLRAPLRTVDAFSDIILKDYAESLDSEGRRLLNLVRSNTRKMDRLIMDLLALSRVTRTELQISHINMTYLVNSVWLENITPEIREKFDFSVSTLPETFGDPGLIRQVWVNLISNAVKYTLPKATRKIEINSFADSNMIVYSIKDSGVGFDPKYAQKLFGVFQRLHKAEDFEGTGIGLAIVRRIINRHGGRTWAEGKIDAGATFYFSLPKRKSPENDPAKQS